MITAAAATASSPSPAVLDLDRLGERIIGLAGRLAAATCRWLLLVAEFDARDGARPAGMASTAHWLAWACGLSARTARDHVRVARSLATHPLLAAEMAAGRLSYSHLRAISRLVRDGEPLPDQLVDDLVNAARHGTTAQLETIVRGLRTVQDTEDGTPAPSENVSVGWTDGNQWRMSARLDPEQGAVVQHALDTIARSRGISRAEALVALAESALASADGPPLRGDERAALVVHVEARPRGIRAAARLADGPGLPQQVLKRLACASRVRLVVHRRHRDGRRTPLDVGRSSRLVTDRQFRALLLREQGHCAHPGCTTRTNLEAHHVVHWLDGGPTDLDNLVLLCRRHHHQHHDGEVGIVALGGGRFRFERAGRVLPVRPDPAQPAGREPAVDDVHRDVASGAATPHWDGSRLDPAWAVSGLAQHLPRGSAEPSGRRDDAA